jgi:hypothetical protein
MKQSQFYISDKEKMDMSFFLCYDPNSILAAIFASFSLKLKRHCIQTGAVAGLIAERAPAYAIPDDMSREDYANAVRYGGFYHDIAAYIAYNEYGSYPAQGEKMLEKLINRNSVSEPVRQVILDTVRGYQERNDSSKSIPLHAGICAIADRFDMFLTPYRHSLFSRGMALEKGAKMISENTGSVFIPEAALCFEAAKADVFSLYRQWKVVPPMWKYSDLKPAERSYTHAIG